MSSTALNATTSLTIDKRATRRPTAREFLARAGEAINAFNVKPIDEFKSYSQHVYVCIEKPIQQPVSGSERFPVSIRLETILHDSAAYETFKSKQEAELFAVELQHLIKETKNFVKEWVYVNGKLFRYEI